MYANRRYYGIQKFILVFLSVVNGHETCAHDMCYEGRRKQAALQAVKEKLDHLHLFSVGCLQVSSVGFLAHTMSGGGLVGREAVGSIPRDFEPWHG